MGNLMTRQVLPAIPRNTSTWLYQVRNNGSPASASNEGRFNTETLAQFIEGIAASIFGPLQIIGPLTGDYEIDTTVSSTWAIDPGGAQRTLTVIGPSILLKVFNIATAGGAGNSLRLDYNVGTGRVQRLNPNVGGEFALDQDNDEWLRILR